jgi:hypothetical protein
VKREAFYIFVVHPVDGQLDPSASIVLHGGGGGALDVKASYSSSALSFSSSVFCGCHFINTASTKSLKV